MVLNQANNNAESTAGGGGYSTSSNPSVYFVCKICRQAFKTVEMFLVHKRREHSEELKGIKVIIFEERFFKTDEDDSSCDDKIFPPSFDPNFVSRNYFENAQSSINTEIKDAINVSSETNFNIKTKNEKTNNTFTTTVNSACANCLDRERDAALKDVCQRNAGQLLPSKRCKTDVRNEKQGTNGESTPSYTATTHDLIKVVNFETEKETAQSEQNDQVQELEDGKFIVARIVKSWDGSDKVQFVSTSTPDSAPEPDIKFIIGTEEIKILDSFSLTKSVLGEDPKNVELPVPPPRKRIRSTEIKTDDRNRNSTPTIVRSAQSCPAANLHKDRKFPDSSVNAIIPLDPDPISMVSAVHSEPTKIRVGSPVICKFCLTKLETEPYVKNHAENCWHHNKDRHIFCITCDKSFKNPIMLKEHKKREHSCTERESKGLGEELDTGGNSDENQLDPDLDLDLDLLPLGEWIQKRKKMFPDIILVDPDPTSDFYLHSVHRWSASFRLMCKLCRFKCDSENEMKSHLKICWAYNKMNHRYCLICGSHFSSVIQFKTHQRVSKKCKSSPSTFHCCSVCHQEFKSRQDFKLCSRILSQNETDRSRIK